MVSMNVATALQAVLWGVSQEKAGSVLLFCDRRENTNCPWPQAECLQTTITGRGSRDSLLVRAPESSSKGCEFESRQERWKNFLRQTPLCVLTLSSPESTLCADSFFSGVHFVRWLFLLHSPLCVLTLSSPESTLCADSFFSRVHFVCWLFLLRSPLCALTLSSPESTFCADSFFSTVHFVRWLFLLHSPLCVLTLFRCPGHPRVTAVARKKKTLIFPKVQVAGYI